MQYHHHNGQYPCRPAGESGKTHLRVDFDRRLRPEFHGSKITSDAGPLAYRELDHAPGLTDMAGSILTEARRGKNIRQMFEGLFRQSVFGLLAEYEDVNDADRLSLDPAMRTIVDSRGLDRNAASTSEIGRFKTEWLTSAVNFVTLVDLPGAWIDRVHAYRPPQRIKTGAKMVRRGRYVTFQLAEDAIPRSLFANIPCLIDDPRPAPLPP